MSYALNLPHDTKGQITGYLDGLGGGAEYRLVRDAILDQLTNIRKNPKLGTPVYGGPFESRRVFRFEVKTGATVHDLQFMYRINEADRVIVVSGMEPTPDT